MKQKARIIVLIVTFFSALLCAVRVALSQSNRAPGEPTNLGHFQQSYDFDGSTSSLSSPNYAQQSSESTTPNHPTFLQGSVMHSEHLAPVEGLKVGTEFDQAKALQSAAPKRVWFRVPPWLAGRWQEEQFTQTFCSNYKTGVKNSTQQTHNAQTTERWGLQRDSAGGIWDVIDLPYLDTTTSDKHVWKDLHTDDSMVFDSDVKVITRLYATRTVADKTTNLITDINQTECFSTFTMAGMDMIKTEYSMKEFDQQGNPIDLREGFRVAHKIAPFQVGDFLRGEDMRPSFRDYLINHGMANLVPTD